MLYKNTLSKLFISLLSLSNIRAMDNVSLKTSILSNYLLPKVGVSDNSLSIGYNNLLNTSKLGIKLNINNYNNIIPINIIVTFKINRKLNINLEREIKSKLSNIIATYKIIGEKLGLQIGFTLDWEMYLGLTGNIKDKDIRIFENQLVSKLGMYQDASERNEDDISKRNEDGNNLEECDNRILDPGANTSKYDDDDFNKRLIKAKQNANIILPRIEKPKLRQVVALLTNEQPEGNQEIGDNNPSSASSTDLTISNNNGMMQLLKNFKEKRDKLLESTVKESSSLYREFLCIINSKGIETARNLYIDFINKLTTIAPFLYKIIPSQKYKEFSIIECEILFKEIIDKSIISISNKGEIFLKNIREDIRDTTYLEDINTLDKLAKGSAKKLLGIDDIGVKGLIVLLLDISRSKLNINNDKNEKFIKLYNDIILIYTGEYNIEEKGSKSTKGDKIIKNIKEEYIDNFNKLITWALIESFHKLATEKDEFLTVFMIRNKNMAKKVQHATNYQEECKLFLKEIIEKDNRDLFIQVDGVYKFNTNSNVITKLSQFIYSTRIRLIEGILQILIEAMKIIKKDHIETISDTFTNSDTFIKILELVETIAKEKYIIKNKIDYQNDEKNIFKLIYSLQEELGYEQEVLKYKVSDKFQKLNSYMMLDNLLIYAKYHKFQLYFIAKYMNSDFFEGLEKLGEVNENIKAIRVIFENLKQDYHKNMIKPILNSDKTECL